MGQRCSSRLWSLTSSSVAHSRNRCATSERTRVKDTVSVQFVWLLQYLEEPHFFFFYRCGECRVDVFVSSLLLITAAAEVKSVSWLAMLRAWREVLMELAESCVFFLIYVHFSRNCSQSFIEASSRKACGQFQALTGWSPLISTQAKCQCTY